MLHPKVNIVGPQTSTIYYMTKKIKSCYIHQTFSCVNIIVITPDDKNNQIYCMKHARLK